MSNCKNTPLYIKINDADNVGIITNDGGLPAGTVFKCGLKLTEYIPEGHKTALEDINTDASVIRYGETIGYALNNIKKGSLVDESRMKMPQAPPLEKLTIADRIPADLPPLEGYTFEGYRNPDGTAGTKNILGIITSVQCMAGVADYIEKKIKKELLPHYPGVDDVIALNHNYGCGFAADAPGAQIPARTLQNIASHPNLGGQSLILGLGCEMLSADKFTSCLNDAKPLIMQEHKGFSSMIKAAMKEAEKYLIKLNERKRETIPLSELVVGIQCGGSDAFSGITANPAAGFAADLLVRSGAAVLFSEVTEIRDAIHLLTPRAADRETGLALIREMKWYDDYLKAGNTDRSSNTSPGNKKGGLSNIVEKALGSISKSGKSAIKAVLGPGEKTNKKGLIFAAAPAGDFVCGTLQIASGIHLQVFTTGRGTPYGLAMVPVIKVGSRNALAEQWPDLIDINAGTIASGQSTIEEKGWEIFRMIIDAASGRKKVWADKWGFYNSLCLFNPAPLT